MRRTSRKDAPLVNAAVRRPDFGFPTSAVSVEKEDQPDPFKAAEVFERLLISVPGQKFDDAGIPGENRLAGRLLRIIATSGFHKADRFECERVHRFTVPGGVPR